MFSFRNSQRSLKSYSKLISSIFPKSDVFHRYCVNVINKRSNVTTSSNNSARCYGQPTCETHPHLLRAGEIVPYIQKNEFQKRRQKLIDLIDTDFTKNSKTHGKQHIIVIPSATKQYMSDKIPYFFRQNTDFLYLSGCLEPDSCLVLMTNPIHQHQSTLFLRDKDSDAELWDGPRTGVQEAIKLFGVDLALPITEFEKYISSYIQQFSLAGSVFWYDYLHPIQKNIHTIMHEIGTKKFNKTWESPTKYIHQLRLIKSPAEILLMQKSCEIASDAIINTIKFSRPGLSEHQIFANVEYQCKMKGADYLSYPPVVAGGNRANIIHYISNNQQLKSGEMVLMDAGCENYGYSSDITRTWPINGKFSLQQDALYEAVLHTQTDLIQLLTTFPTLDNLFNSMCLLLGKQLQLIGLIPKTASREETMKAAFAFCPHHVSHYLGMDVHDTSLIPRNIKIQPGMVITVEPGVYIQRSHQVPAEFNGLGIRIEDDILITENGPVVLTKGCPKTVADLEKLASENQK